MPLCWLENSVSRDQPLLSLAWACPLSLSVGSHLAPKFRNFNGKLLVDLQGGLTIVLAETWNLCVVSPCGQRSFSTRWEGSLQLAEGYFQGLAARCAFSG